MYRFIDVSVCECNPRRRRPPLVRWKFWDCICMHAAAVLLIFHSKHFAGSEDVRFQLQIGIGDFLFEAAPGTADTSLLMFQTIGKDGEGTIRTFAWEFGATTDRLVQMTACTRPGPEMARDLPPRRGILGRECDALRVEVCRSRALVPPRGRHRRARQPKDEAHLLGAVRDRL